MIDTSTFASLMEASYDRLYPSYYQRFYEELLEEGLDDGWAGKRAASFAERHAYDEAERQVEAMF